MIFDIYTIWRREIIKFSRTRSRIVSSVVMPIVWLTFIGVGFSSSVQLPGVEYMDFLAPGIVGMIILFTSIFSGVSVIWDRQFGFLKEILVAPVSRISIVLGKTMGGATVAVIHGAIMLAISSAMGLIPFDSNFAAAFGFMGLTSVCFVSIGLIIATQMRSMEGFQTIMSFLIMPIFFLSGALFPIENTPGWMQLASYFDPLTYGIDGIRNSLGIQGNVPIIANGLVLTGFCVGLIMVGSYLFKRTAI